jgi:hypothetical protein
MIVRIGWALVLLAATGGDEPAIDAKPYSRVLFEDEFEGPALAKEWKSFKSASTIRDGALVCIEPPDAGHNSVNSVEVSPVGDIVVDLSFKLAGAKRFGVAFNDKAYKGSHAGHICRVTIDATSLTYQDDRDGIFKNEIFDKKEKGAKPDAATQKLLEDKSSKIKATFEEGKWYALSLRIKGDLMEVLLDGVSQGQFRSTGVAHAEKRNVALVTSGREVHVDHLKIRTTP